MRQATRKAPSLEVSFIFKKFCVTIIFIARVIKPKKSGAVSSARIQSSLTKANLKKIEASLVSKTKAAGEGSLRLVRPDPSLLEAAESKKSKKAVAAAKKSEMKDMNES
jgi:hypothetical protein